MAVSLARRIRRIGFLPGKVKDPTLTPGAESYDPVRHKGIISELRHAAKQRRLKARGKK